MTWNTAGGKLILGLIATLFTSACGQLPAKPMRLVEASSELTLAVGWPPDSSEVKPLHEETESVVASAEFRAFLARIALLRPSKSRPQVSGQMVERIYSGLDPEHVRIAIRYEIQSSWGQTASTKHTCKGNECVATIRLGKETLRRAQPGMAATERDPYLFACAVNTLAHEWAHVYRNESGFTFEDQGHKRSEDAFASYAIGSLAQCVYLREHVNLPLDLHDCVERIGTNQFRAMCSRAAIEKMIGASD